MPKSILDVLKDIYDTLSGGSGPGTVVTQSDPNDLNANANIQVGDTDVSNANPMPVSDAGGSLTIDGTVAATQSGTWTAREVPANAGTTSISTITTSASSVGGVANQVAISVFPIGTGSYHFNLGGTATTSNATITPSSPLIVEDYSGSISLIRSSGSGDVQVTVLTRS